MCSLRKSEKHRDQNTASEEEHEEERAADDTQPSLTDEKSLSLSLSLRAPALVITRQRM